MESVEKNRCFELCTYGISRKGERQMRTLTYGGAVSLDGFLAGVNGSIDWLHFSKDVRQVMADYWKNVDTILMGRKTYAVSVAENPKKAKRGKRTEPAMRTYVFSRTLEKIDKPGVKLVSDDAVDFVRHLKQEAGKDICLMGGGEFARSLLAAGLVDKVGLNIHPILLGAGIPTFRDCGHRIKLTLTECRTLEGGCILANYQVMGTR
jgi:dihydrofolate reductase